MKQLVVTTGNTFSHLIKITTSTAMFVVSYKSTSGQLYASKASEPTSADLGSQDILVQTTMLA